MFKISGGSRVGEWGGLRVRRGAQAGNGTISNLEKQFHARAVVTQSEKWLQRAILMSGIASPIRLQVL